jgi:hypothetical protein
MPETLEFTPAARNCDTRKFSMRKLAGSARVQRFVIPRLNQGCVRQSGNAGSPETVVIIGGSLVVQATPRLFHLSTFSGNKRTS